MKRERDDDPDETPGRALYRDRAGRTLPADFAITRGVVIVPPRNPRKQKGSG